MIQGETTMKRTGKKIRTMAGLLLLLAPLCPLYGQRLEQNVMGGGGTGMSGGNLNVVATFGQPLAGIVRSGDMTIGQGFWYAPRERGETSGVSEGGETSGEMKLHVFPNPVRTAGRVTISLAEIGPLRLTLYDNLGRTVRLLFEGAGTKGTTEIDLDVDRLEAGNYLLVLEAGIHRIAEPVVILQ